VVFVASAGLLVYRTVALAKVLSANAKVPLPPGLAPFHEWSHPQPTPRSSADAR
jgi:hypothetical protein